MSRRILVAMGGRSSEREVSLVSGAACAKALAEAGHQVTSFDAIRPIGELVAALAPQDGTPAPEIVFNALHGRFGEDGTVQGLLELMKIPYTHSGLLASAIAMDKPMAKVVMAAAGLPVPDGVLVPLSALLAGDPLPRPYVAKPPNEGSSVGVHIVHAGDNLGSVEAELRRGDHLVLVERFIPGRELTVGVMGEGAAARALTVTEIRPKAGMFYDYDAKYSTAMAAAHVVPAALPAAELEGVMAIAVAAHRALGCRGVSRTDLRYDDSAPAGRRAVVLEVNTQPGMTPLSLVPEQAAHCGMSFTALCLALVEAARCDS